VFGKKDNTHAVELSDIAAGIDGFVIIGESAGDYSGHSVAIDNKATCTSGNG
jgi:hypothetical protein